MKIKVSAPASTASSTAYWISGLSSTGSISLATTLDAGRKRVPSPATGNTTLRSAAFIQAPSVLARDRHDFGGIRLVAPGKIRQQAGQAGAQGVFVVIAHGCRGLAQLRVEQLPRHATRLREEDLGVLGGLVILVVVEQFLEQFFAGAKAGVDDGDIALRSEERRVGKD